MASDFYEVITEAISDLTEHGFDSQSRVDEWMRRIKVAAKHSLVPEAVLERAMRDTLARVYERTVNSGKMMKIHKGISHYTLESIKPKLRSELDRRILASASLIKLNREASIQRTVQRFSAWATSIPSGGSNVVDRSDVKKTVRKGIASLPFEERRVIVDQGHKLVAAVNEIVAKDGGAIAATWRHVNEGGGYQARPAHEQRDGQVFLLRDSWAVNNGLVKLSGRKYTDQVEQPGELVFCRCQWVFSYSLKALPLEMLTAKGKQSLLEARAQIKRFG